MRNKKNRSRAARGRLASNFPKNRVQPLLSSDNPSSKLLPLGALVLAGGIGLSGPANAQQANSEVPFAASSTMKVANGEVQLQPVQVQADQEKAPSYLGTKTRVGKIAQDPHEIPQAVTTVTEKLLDEQKAGSLKEALRNVSGVSFNAAEGGRAGDNINLRGFYTFGDIYLDGIRDTAQYNRETFNLEQIDVLRGAGAMLFGRGQAGGVINQVSKMASLREQSKLTGSIGTDGFQESTLDVNKPIAEDAAVRFNLLQRDEGSWRNNPATGTEPEIHRKGAALSVGLNLLSNNNFWVNYYELQTHDNPDYGISFDPATREPTRRIPDHYFYGNDRTFDDSKTRITTLINDYQLSAQSRLRTQLRLADYDRSYWAKTPNLTNPPDANGAVGGNVTRAASYTTTTLQSDFSSSEKLWGLRHEWLAGVEYLKEESRRRALQNFGTAANPDFRPYQESTTATPVAFEGDSVALYVQDTVEFMPGWKATAGVRRDHLDAQYSSTTSPQLSYGENSYRSALSWQPDQDTHYYLSWSDSFSPTADLYQLTGTPQPPERSHVVELGGKWMFMDGDLALRSALYSAVKTYERNTDLESTAAILTKKRKTNGLEFEAAGRITPLWEVFAGVAFMNAKILEVAQNTNATTGMTTNGDPQFAGQRARNTPKYTANLWSTYQFAPCWKVSGGLEAKGDRQAFNPSSAAAPTLNGAYYPNTAPAYVRWDGALAYEERTWAVRLNVKNLLDELYYDAVYDNGSFTVPGQRRTVILTGEYKF